MYNITYKHNKCEYSIHTIYYSLIYINQAIHYVYIYRTLYTIQDSIQTLNTRHILNILYTYTFYTTHTLHIIYIYTHILHYTNIIHIYYTLHYTYTYYYTSNIYTSHLPTASGFSVGIILSNRQALSMILPRIK